MPAEPLSDIRAIWAKLGKAKDAIPHPLICHMLDTAAVADVLWDTYLGPQLKAELEQALAPLGDPKQWVSMFCGLHDLGKCSPAFQGMRADIAECLLAAPESTDVKHVSPIEDPDIRRQTHHGIVTGFRLGQLLHCWGSPPAATNELACAVGGHHGIYPTPEHLDLAGHRQCYIGGDRWQRLCEENVAEFIRLRDLPDPSLLPWHQVRLSPRAAIALAGLTTISDWIASDLKRENHAGSNVDLAAYAAETPARHFDKVDKMGWRPWKPRTTSFSTMFPEISEMRPVQRKVESLIKEATEPGVLVVSAPTGEGKTKTALQAAATLVMRCGMLGMYYGLPNRISTKYCYQTTDAMLSESCDSMPLRLLHSSAKTMLSDIASPRAISLTGINEDGPNGDDTTAVTDWFHKNRGLCAPLGIGTVDQVFPAAMRVKYLPVMLGALSGKVVIFDEVHSYDAFMDRRFERLLWWLGRLGAPVIILSATLTSQAEEKLIAMWRAGANDAAPSDFIPDDTATAPYPRVRWATASEGGEPHAVPASELNQHRELRVTELSEEQRVTWAVGQAAKRRNIAIFRNTVGQVNETVARLREELASRGLSRLPDPIVLHAQLDDASREAKEREVFARLGPNGERPEGLIVVGTTLLEQSLDLDFDAVVTDPVAIDRLIQRAGRIYRHRLANEPLDLAIIKATDKPDGTVKLPPYSGQLDPIALPLRTWALLKSEFIDSAPTRTLMCPDQVQVLLDRVYDRPEEFEAASNHGQLRTAEADRQRREAVHRFEAGTDELPLDCEDLELAELTQDEGQRSHSRKQGPGPDSRNNTKRE